MPENAAEPGMLLTEEALDSVLPALSPLARLVHDKGGHPGLAAVAEAMAALPSAAFSEAQHTAVQGWVNVLVDYRGAARAADFEEGRNLLMRSGVPEIPAAMTIERVAPLAYQAYQANQAAQGLPADENIVTASPYLPLRVSTEYLGFGEIEAGREVQRTFIAEGGPGDIRAAPASISVHPQRFGPHPTTVTVTVRLSTASHLMGRIALQTARESREIDVIATGKDALASPAPTSPVNLAPAALGTGSATSHPIPGLSAASPANNAPGPASSAPIAAPANTSIGSHYHVPSVNVAPSVRLPALALGALIALGILVPALILGFVLVHRYDASLPSIPVSRPSAAGQSQPSSHPDRDRLAQRQSAAKGKSEQAKRLLDSVQASLVELSSAQKAGHLPEATRRQRQSALRSDCRKAGDLAAAAIRDDPESVEARVQQIAALYYLGEFARANALLQDAERRFPTATDFKPLQALVTERLKAKGTRF